MAKRVVIESDLSKQECPEEDMVKLSIKRKSKSVRTYEISNSDAEKLEQQLVSGKQLDIDWIFANKRQTYISPTEASGFEPETKDEDFVTTKKRERKLVLGEDTGVDLIEESGLRNGPEIVKASNEGDCVHMNKTPPKMTIRNDESYAYANCKDCGIEIPIHKRDDRKNYLSSTPPKGSREGKNKKVEER